MEGAIKREVVYYEKRISSSEREERERGVRRTGAIRGAKRTSICTARDHISGHFPLGCGYGVTQRISATGSVLVSIRLGSQFMWSS